MSKVAIQGIKGSYHHQVAMEFFGNEIEIAEFMSFDELVNSMIDDHTINEILTNKISTIGENMAIRRLSRLEGDSVASYVHNSAADGMGKIGVLVSLQGDDNGIGKQIAMHIAAANPASLSEDDLDSGTIEREKLVLSEQARESGKPEAVIEKMIIGRMNKFFEEVTLLKQKFVINPDITVSQAAADAGKLAIGVDKNQNGLRPGSVLTSMLKRVDVAAYETFTDAKAGKFTAGLVTLGLAEGGVDWALDDNNASLITADMKTAVEKAFTTEKPYNNRNWD